MKKLLVSASLAAALLASPQDAKAQGETYTVTVNTAGNVAKLDVGRQLANQTLLSRFNLPSNATQSDVCAASLAQTGAPASGSSCTLVEANGLGIRLFANSQAGRELFINLNMVKGELDGFARQKAKLDFAAMQAFCKVATQPQIDGVCTATGLSAGCAVCDSFR